MLARIKQIALSLSVIILFALYSLQRHALLPGDTTAPLAIAPTVLPTNSNTGSRPTQTVPASAQKDAGALVSTRVAQTGSGGQRPSATAQATSTPAGLFADGTYTGDITDANWGDVQVQVVVAGGEINDVQFLTYPDHRSRSRSINSRAVPELRQEAIAAQSPDVDVVSGATDTSEAFIESLSSALDQATR